MKKNSEYSPDSEFDNTISNNVLTDTIEDSDYNKVVLLLKRLNIEDLEQVIKVGLQIKSDKIKGLSVSPQGEKFKAKSKVQPIPNKESFRSYRGSQSDKSGIKVYQIPITLAIQDIQSAKKRKLNIDDLIKLEASKWLDDYNIQVKTEEMLNHEYIVYDDNAMYKFTPDIARAEANLKDNKMYKFSKAYLAVKKAQELITDHLHDPNYELDQEVEFQPQNENSPFIKDVISNEVIDLIKSALEDEYYQANLYAHYSQFVIGLDSETVRSHFQEHLMDELSHLSTLQRHLVGINEKPTSNPSDSIVKFDNLSIREIIALQLVYEKRAVEKYKKILSMLGESPSGLKVDIENILSKETEHAQDLLTLLL